MKTIAIGSATYSLLGSVNAAEWNKAEPGDWITVNTIEMVGTQVIRRTDQYTKQTWQIANT